MMLLRGYHVQRFRRDKAILRRTLMETMLYISIYGQGLQRNSCGYK